MKLCSKVKKSELVLDLSCRKKDNKYYIVTDRWQKFTSLELNKDTLEFFAQYACEFLIHAVDVEGKCNGIDPTLVDTLGKYSPIPAVYAGGIKDISDIELIEKSGKGIVHYTIGSALDIFGGTLSFEEVVSR
jgi:phosphoribosylformimino-5-aminoimidazole carboxamide ribotide isomerase